MSSMKNYFLVSIIIFSSTATGCAHDEEEPADRPSAIPQLVLTESASIPRLERSVRSFDLKQMAQEAPEPPLFGRNSRSDHTLRRSACRSVPRGLDDKKVWLEKKITKKKTLSELTELIHPVPLYTHNQEVYQAKLTELAFIGKRAEALIKKESDPAQVRSFHKKLKRVEQDVQTRQCLNTDQWMLFCWAQIHQNN